MTNTEKSGGCFLCRLPAEHKDDENYILYRGATVFVLMNLYPYNTGHVMVAPYEHTGDLAGLSPAVVTEMMTVTQRCVRVLREVYEPDGFNAGMNLGPLAGAGEPDHVHMHLVPRWAADTNFMPVIGDTKVLPESLDETYAKLRPHFP